MAMNIRLFQPKLMMFSENEDLLEGLVFIAKGFSKSGSDILIRYLPMAVPITFSKFVKYTWYASRASRRSFTESD